MKLGREKGSGGQKQWSKDLQCTYPFGHQAPAAFDRGALTNRTFFQHSYDARETKLLFGRQGYDDTAMSAVPNGCHH